MTDIKPEDIERTQFTSKMRGYDPEEVDAFLRNVAGQLRTVQAQAEKGYQALGEQMGDLLQHAKDRADEMNKAAEEAAVKTGADADSDAKKARAEAESDAKKAREDAAADAANMRAEAEGDAKRMRDEANADAHRLRTDAERDANDMIERAEARVREVENNEIQLRAELGELKAALASITEHLGRLADTPVARTVPETAGRLRITPAGKGEVLEDTVTGELTETMDEVPQPSAT